MCVSVPACLCVDFTALQDCFTHFKPNQRKMDMSEYLEKTIWPHALRSKNDSGLKRCGSCALNHSIVRASTHENDCLPLFQMGKIIRNLESMALLGLRLHHHCQFMSKFNKFDKLRQIQSTDRMSRFSDSENDCQFGRGFKIMTNEFIAKPENPVL